MTEEVTVVTPEAERGSGGLADYAWRIADQWGDRAVSKFGVPRSAAELRGELPASGGRVLVHYSAYGFDAWGYPRWLLHELARWKQRAGGILVLMLHEIWTFWPVLNKNYVVQQLHRRDLAKLLIHADAVFTSTSSQAEHLRACSGRDVEVLPVGSNIAVHTIAEEKSDPGLAIVFGLQGTRLRTLKAMDGDLRALAAGSHLSHIVTCGQGESADDENRERELLAGIGLRDGFEQRGSLPEAEISKLLAQARFGISAQDQLSLTKSGTFMAYAAHGLNVLSPAANPAGPEPLCYLVAARELLDGLPSEELRDRANKLRTWQQRTASWPQIADRLARGLRLSFSSQT